MAKQVRSERGVTVKDVAAACGYAVSTCIDVLGGRGGRYSDTANRVVTEAAAKLGYRPHAMARAMRTGRTNAVALIGGTDLECSVIPGELLYAINDALALDGKHLTFASLPDAVLTQEGALPRLLEEWFCDGMLINYQKRVPPGFAALVDVIALPAVWINNKRPHSCVHPDDQGGLAMATERLLACGHTRVCYVDTALTKPSADRHYSIADRYAGYVSTMRAAGLQPQVLGTADAPWPGERHAVERIAALFAEVSPPTAVITSDQVCLAACVAELRRRDLRAGPDCSLINIGSNPVWHLGVEIDTARVPIEQVGARAVTMLLSMKEKSRPRPCAVPYTWMPCGSVAERG
ncbi:MAG: LacI family DNA-binding transcriptional regulator [Planctomycetota bacterium]|jgi:LacI family transcriptional regulator|nr:LacI family DNA-binding transcriptional regulator [Planctomycetota bacterium]